MNEKMFQAIQAALLASWDGKLPALLVCARNFAFGGVTRIRSVSEAEREAEIERSIREAYLAGYRRAYWDGIVDFVEAASTPDVKPPENITSMRVSDIVH